MGASAPGCKCCAQGRERHTYTDEWRGGRGEEADLDAAAAQNILRRAHSVHAPASKDTLSMTSTKSNARTSLSETTKTPAKEATQTLSTPDAGKMERRGSYRERRKENADGGVMERRRSKSPMGPSTKSSQGMLGVGEAPAMGRSLSARGSVRAKNTRGSMMRSSSEHRDEGDEKTPAPAPRKSGLQVDSRASGGSIRKSYSERRHMSAMQRSVSREAGTGGSTGDTFAPKQSIFSRQRSSRRSHNAEAQVESDNDNSEPQNSPQRASYAERRAKRLSLKNEEPAPGAEEEEKAATPADNDDDDEASF